MSNSGNATADVCGRLSSRTTQDCGRSFTADSSKNQLIFSAMQADLWFLLRFSFRFTSRISRHNVSRMGPEKEMKATQFATSFRAGNGPDLQPGHVQVFENLLLRGILLEKFQKMQAFFFFWFFFQ